MHPLRFTLLMLISLFMLVGCFSEGPRVMVETEQPENEFVVVCEWYGSGIINLHGGNKEIKSTMHIVSSGEILDCGTSIFGGVASARSLHPLYSGSYGCISHTCKNDTFYLRNRLVVLKPESIENKLVRLQSEFSNEDIVKGKMIASFFSNESYFEEYKKVKELNIPYMQEIYNNRLMLNWEVGRRIYKNIENGKSELTSDEFIKYFWRKVSENS